MSEDRLYLTPVTKYEGMAAGSRPPEEMACYSIMPSYLQEPCIHNTGNVSIHVPITLSLSRVNLNRIQYAQVRSGNVVAERQ